VFRGRDVGLEQRARPPSTARSPAASAGSRRRQPGRRCAAADPVPATSWLLNAPRTCTVMPGYCFSKPAAQGVYRAAGPPPATVSRPSCSACRTRSSLVLPPGVCGGDIGQ
jgi:hypothetical protein